MFNLFNIKGNQAMTVEIKIKVEKQAKIPQYQSKGASGLDVCAYIEQERILEPGAIDMVPTGLHAEIPLGYEIQIRPRSGLSLKHGIVVLNSPGTIDSDYRGQIQLILINHSKVPFKIENGMRLAQLVVCKVEQAHLVLQEELSTTERQLQGFGSTGAK
jgi:dUTP pyrophosphatase